jgi:hypothetical protein
LTKGSFVGEPHTKLQERSVASDIVEGVFYGLLAAAIAVGMLYLIFS